MILFEPRASTIIFNYLLSNYEGHGYWLLPINSCPVVPLTFVTADVPFKLVDLNKDSLSMDSRYIKEALRDSNCKGIFYIYSYGLDFSSNELFKYIKNIRKDIHIIEDKCLNTPSFNLEDSSPFADLSLYSTGYGKFVDIGYGGFAVHHDKINYKKNSTLFNKEYLKNFISQYKECLRNDSPIKKLMPAWLDDRPFKMDVPFYMNEVVRLRSEVNVVKDEINLIYSKNIPDKVWMRANGHLANSWRFNIQIDEGRDELLQKIFENNLFASTHYQPVDKIFDVERVGSGEVAYSIFNTVINLFNDKYFNVEKAADISFLINNFLLDNKYENTI